jgi:IS605 OrfB family transposase
MIIDSKYSKSFISDNLSDSKYDELLKLAMTVNEHKNLLSKEISENLSAYIDMSFFDFLKLMRNRYKNHISSNFDKQLYQDVFICYQNKFEAIQNNIVFDKITFNNVEFYKRDSKNNKKGDFKKVNTTKEKTNLSICLTYLSRYGNDNIINFINDKLLKTDLTKGKINFYNNILNCVNKFGFDRLFSLSLQKRNRIIDKYKTPIEFKSLTLRGRSRLNHDIITYNENYNSKIKAFINISWLGRGNKLVIPVKYSKKYHGLMNEYHKETPDVEYLICFTNNGKIKINICKDGKRLIPDNKTNYIGIDVNVKHNLFSLSDDTNFDYNRKLLNELTNELSKIDKLKKNKEYNVGKKKQKLIDSIRNKVKKSNEQLCSDVCKYLNSIGKNHIVMENLDNVFGKSFVKDSNNNNLNFNRIIKELKISSLKQMIEHISVKYDISLSTVHSSYTSKACSKCGCIDDGNRLSQEEFKCVECGYEDNADHNAAINIEKRVSSTVLRTNLLKQSKLGNGTYEPKILKREKVKEILLSFRYNPPLKVDRDIVNMNNFDYI